MVSKCMMEGTCIKLNIPKLFLYFKDSISLEKKTLLFLLSGLHCIKIKIVFTFKILLALTKGKWPIFEMKRHTGDGSQWNLVEHIGKFMQK